MSLFVARQMSCGRMRGHRHETSRCVLPALVEGWLMPRTRQAAVDRLPHWKTIYGRAPEPGRAE